MSSRKNIKDNAELSVEYRLKDEDRIAELFELINQNIDDNIPTDAIVLKELRDLFRDYSLRSFNAALYLQHKNIEKKINRISSIIKRFDYNFKHSYAVDVIDSDEEFHNSSIKFDFGKPLKIEISLVDAIKYVVKSCVHQEYVNGLEPKVEISKTLIKYLHDNKVSIKKFTEYKRKVLAAVICETLGFAVFSGKKKDAKASEYENSFSHHYKKAKAELGM
jgi:hypothetical protein